MRYFLGFLVAIGLIVLVFILVLHGFSGGNKNKATKTQTALVDYATTNTTMQLTMDGPITADQKHQGIRISVGRSESKIELYQGYQNDVTLTKTYANNQDGYAQFLRALDLAGYTKKNTDASRRDERGVCATGKRYIYEIMGSGDTQRTWSSSCSNGQGSFIGNGPQVRTLFEQQIPEYSQLTTNTGL